MCVFLTLYDIFFLTKQGIKCVGQQARDNTVQLWQSGAGPACAGGGRGAGGAWPRGVKI